MKATNFRKATETFAGVLEKNWEYFAYHPEAMEQALDLIVQSIIADFKNAEIEKSRKAETDKLNSELPNGLFTFAPRVNVKGEKI